jgi:hypothetical protein
MPARTISATAAGSRTEPNRATVGAAGCAGQDRDVVGVQTHPNTPSGEGGHPTSRSGTPCATSWNHMTANNFHLLLQFSPPWYGNSRVVLHRP